MLRRHVQYLGYVKVRYGTTGLFMMVLVGSKETQEWYTTDSEGCFALVLKGSADDDSGSRSSLTRHPFGSDGRKLQKRVHRPASFRKSLDYWPDIRLLKSLNTHHPRCQM